MTNLLQQQARPAPDASTIADRSCARKYGSARELVCAESGHASRSNRNRSVQEYRFTARRLNAFAALVVRIARIRHHQADHRIGPGSRYNSASIATETTPART